MAKRNITQTDLISDQEFAQHRKTYRDNLRPRKQLRRIAIGPDVTFYFECYDTMVLQIQEMLLIEKGGAAQIADELAAYDPLVPKGNELVATVMIEIADERRRLKTLLGLTHFEQHLFLQISDQKIYAIAEEDAERTSADGKTSSVHFVRFGLNPDQQQQFGDPKAQILLGIDHNNYAHMAVLSPASRQELSTDF